MSKVKHSIKYKRVGNVDFVVQFNLLNISIIKLSDRAICVVGKVDNYPFLYFMGCNGLLRTQKRISLNIL